MLRLSLVFHLLRSPGLYLACPAKGQELGRRLARPRPVAAPLFIALLRSLPLASQQAPSGAAVSRQSPLLYPRHSRCLTNTQP
ncbi:hypothetical protein E2320_003229 [Naja naja]|nr:hypothetical protein E2320_003229 [Naja naja]